MAITIDGTNGLSSDNAALKLDGTTLVVDEANNRVGVGTASPAVAMDVVGQVRASTGILFGSDTAAANALDDYEEGTWTPSVGGTATYTLQQGRYTKIGNLVFLYGNMVINTIGTGNTQFMSGVPFTNTEECTMSINKLTNSSLSFYSVQLRTAGTSLYISGQSTLSGAITVNQTFMQNGTAVQFSGCYVI